MEDYSGLVVIWLVCGLLGGLIASNRSQQSGGFVIGFMLGVLLGPLGVILTLFVKPSAKAIANTNAKEGKRECPHCREWMKREASVCPHCQRESPAWILHEGRLWTKDATGADIWWDQRTKQWVKV